MSEEKADYRCYYPFLDYSPELAALREAAARGIPARFIDLPYGEILTAVREGRGLRRGGEKNNYNDDYLLARSAYIQRLCEKTGARNFDELWENILSRTGCMRTGILLLLTCLPTAARPGRAPLWRSWSRRAA